MTYITKHHKSLISKLLLILLVLFMLISLTSCKNNDNNTANTVDEDTLVIEEPINVGLSIEDPYIIKINDDLSYIIDLSTYKVLNHNDLIAKYNYASDYYDEESLEKLLAKDLSYKDLEAESIDTDNNNFISISISKPSKSLNNKQLLSDLDTQYLLDYINDNHLDKYADLDISVGLTSLLDQQTVNMDLSYIDENNTNIYNKVLYLIGQDYLYTISITSIKQDVIDEILSLFNIYE